MDLAQRYEPELVAALQASPFEMLIDWDDLSAVRDEARKMLAVMAESIPDSPKVAKEDRFVRRQEDSWEIPVRVYRPAEVRGPLLGLLWIHGGGYVLGNIQQDDLMVQHIVEEVGCVAISVEYRLAPEHPFPIPLQDCYAVLTWMANHTSDLGIDPTHIAVGGASAGGGLAAGLVLLARDRGEVAVAFQLLMYPMIDDRDVTPSSEAFAGAPVWSRQDNRRGWRAYLGAAVGGAEVSAYAAAARATDLSNLPPAYIAVGSQELFLDEDAEYALRLAHAGVPVELHIYPCAYHSWDAIAPTAAVSQQSITNRDQALKRALHRDEASSAA